MKIVCRANDGKEIDGAVITFNSMRGVMAIWIVLGHLGMNMNADQGVFLILQKFNLAVVGMFFFLSGYGLEKGYANKNGYLKTVLLKKIPRLFIMALVQYLVGEFSYAILGYKRQTAGFILEFFKNANWYIWEIIALYLLFYFSHLILKDAKAYYVAAIITLFMMIFLYVIEGANAACYSGMAFPAGMIIYRMGEKAGAKIKRSYTGYLILSVILTAAAGCTVFLTKTGVISVIEKNLFCITSSWLVLMIFMKIEVRSRVLAFLAAMSPEIYLYQFTATIIVALILYKFGIIKHGAGYALLSLAATLILSMVIYFCRKTIEDGLRKKEKKGRA